MSLKLDGISSLRIANEVNRQREDYGKELIKISSGNRLSSLGANPADRARVSRMRAHSASLKMSQRNAEDGKSMIQVAEGSLNEQSSILTRLRELAIQSASGTYGDEERSYLDMEFQHLTEELDRIGKTTKWGERDLLNASMNSEQQTSFQVGASSSEHSQISYDSGNINSTSDNYNLYKLSVSDQGDAYESIETIDEAMSELSGFRAQLGAIQSRLERRGYSLDNEIVATEEGISRIADTDYAQSASKMMKHKLSMYSGTSILADLNSQESYILKLIG